MMSKEELKKKENLDYLKWILEELRRFQEEKKEWIIENLIWGLEDSIRLFDAPIYNLWLYYEEDDKWMKAMVSYSNKFTEDSIRKFLDKRDNVTKYLVCENILPNEVYNNEIMEFLLNYFIKENYEIKEVDNSGI